VIVPFGFSAMQKYALWPLWNPDFEWRQGRQEDAPDAWIRIRPPYTWNEASSSLIEERRALVKEEKGELNLKTRNRG
jgi:hypothetical protein